MSAKLGHIGILLGASGHAPPQLMLEAWREGYSNGAPVTVAHDQSGFGNDALGGGAGGGPTYVTNVFNGKAAYRFNGTDQFLLTPVIASYAGLSRRWYEIVYCLRALGGSTTILWQGSNTGATAPYDNESYNTTTLVSGQAGASGYTATAAQFGPPATGLFVTDSQDLDGTNSVAAYGNNNQVSVSQNLPAGAAGVRIMIGAATPAVPAAFSKIDVLYFASGNAVRSSVDKLSQHAYIKSTYFSFVSNLTLTMGAFPFADTSGAGQSVASSGSPAPSLDTVNTYLGQPTGSFPSGTGKLLASIGSINLGRTSWTIDCDVYFSNIAFGAGCYIASSGTNNGDDFYIGIYGGSGALLLGDTVNNQFLTGVGTFTNATWQHCRITYSYDPVLGTAVISGFIAGVLKQVSTTLIKSTVQTSLNIGYRPSTTSALQGNIANFVFTPSAIVGSTP